MADKPETHFNYSPVMQNLYSDITNILVQHSDYEGIGGHQPIADKGTHPLHNQVSIGVVERTGDMRVSS